MTAEPHAYLFDPTCSHCVNAANFALAESTDPDPWDEAVQRFFAGDVPRTVLLEDLIGKRNGGHAEFFAALAKLILAERAAVRNGGALGPSVSRDVK